MIIGYIFGKCGKKLVLTVLTVYLNWLTLVLIGQSATDFGHQCCIDTACNGGYDPKE